MRPLRHLLGPAILTFALVGGAMAGQDWRTTDPLMVDARYETVGRQTKYVVTFRNGGSSSVNNLRIDRVGLYIFNREFCPAFTGPSIAPGKTWTFSVWLRGNISTVSGCEKILVDGDYRVGSRRVEFHRRTNASGQGISYDPGT